MKYSPSPVKEQERDDFVIKEPEDAAVLTKKDKKKKKKDKEKTKGPDTEQWNKMSFVTPEVQEPPKKR